MKTKIHLTILAIVSVVLITGCKKDNFKEIVGICPIVQSVSPANGATSIPLSLGISVTFNENMNPATFNLTSCDMESPFTLQGLTQVAGKVSYSGTTATFTSSENLLPGTTYTATITGKVKNLAGIPLSKNFIWSFTTAGESDGNIILGNSTQVKKVKI
jgi:hypothetical protein